MTRAVLDTNIVISALLFEGVASALVPAWRNHRFAFLVSQALLAEYIRVLHYPKFRLTQEDIRHLLEEDILPFITPVKVIRTPRVVLADPADDHVLACAIAGKADLLVTGDPHLLKLIRHRRVPMVTLSQFLHQLGLSS